MKVDVGRLGPSLSTAEACRLLKCSHKALWSAVRDGDCPVPHYRVGRALRFPTQPILELLGLTPATGIDSAEQGVDGAPLVAQSDEQQSPEGDHHHPFDRLIVATTLKGRVHAIHPD